MRLQNKIAVVTGAHRGIGHAIASALGREGATVLAIDIIAKTPEFDSPSIVYHPMDVASKAEWSQLGARIGRDHGRLDILVNAAGITSGTAAVHDVELSDWDKIIAVNQTGVMLGMQMAVGL